jgi:hypothetical protein
LPPARRMVSGLPGLATSRCAAPNDERGSRCAGPGACAPDRVVGASAHGGRQQPGQRGERRDPEEQQLSRPSAHARRHFLS